MSRLLDENGISADAAAAYLTEVTALAEENAAAGGNTLIFPPLWTVTTGLQGPKISRRR